VSPSADARFSPGQAIAFDWSDVTGASSYTIEIDDTDTFTATAHCEPEGDCVPVYNNTLPTRRLGGAYGPTMRRGTLERCLRCEGSR